MIDLQAYMAESIRRIMGNAYRSVLGNPREARFVMQMQRAVRRSERRRRTLMEDEGIQVPPFLIASIATACNLQCKGCYARKNGIATEQPTKPTLAADQWGSLFAEAEGLGVNFCLLAGGEPLTRRDILEQAAAAKGIIFPVFTNGTMIGATYTEFFRKHLNMVPVISLEGDAADTDTRRGAGIYRRVMAAMDTLHSEKLFFGTSITVTTENYRRVTSEEYLRELHGKGCRLVFYVEYVPFDESTRHLAFGDDEVAAMEERVEQMRTLFDDIVFLSFPGDEKALDGCMAAGRGFFHIGPDGSAEPCPFSPYSDTNVARDGLRAALQSPLFAKLREANNGSWQHTGGCTLYEHREEVEQMLGNKK